MNNLLRLTTGLEIVFALLRLMAGRLDTVFVPLDCLLSLVAGLEVPFDDLVRLMAGPEAVLVHLENLLRFLEALTGHKAEHQLGGFFRVCLLFSSLTVLSCSPLLFSVPSLLSSVVEGWQQYHHRLLAHPA